MKRLIKHKDTETQRGLGRNQTRSVIPLLVRRGGREIKRMRRSLRIRADGGVAAPNVARKATTPAAPHRWLRGIVLLAQPPLLTRRGLRLHEKSFQKNKNSQ